MEGLVEEEKFEMSLEEYEQNFYMQRQRQASEEGNIGDTQCGAREHMGSVQGIVQDQTLIRAKGLCQAVARGTLKWREWNMF